MPQHSAWRSVALAALGLTDADRLPRTLVPDGDATLVVLWHVDNCTALTDEPPAIVVANRWGLTGTAALRFSPFTGLPGGSGDLTSVCGL
ncbi:MAG: hypothetical protein FWF28_05610 [Micrococcales bacterium]|nr:hypothetical protein [Micrococcales bacterium]